MATNQIFSITSGAGKSLAVTATTAQVAITVSDTVRVVNLGPNKCYMRFSATAAPEAVVTDACIPVGVEVFFAPGTVAVAAICDATETATLKLIPGNGA